MQYSSILFAAAIAAATSPPLLAAGQHPRISMHTARSRALALVPGGRIRSAELEREHGRLIYSFDIATPRGAGVEEIQISAITGRLVSRTHEKPAAERREAIQERRETRHH